MMRDSQTGKLSRLALAMASGLLATSAFATNYTVTSGADVIAMDGEVTLREALQAANTNTAVGDAPAGESSGDTISIGALTVTLGGTELSITDGVSISGTGTVSAAEGSRVFSIAVPAASGSVAISGITIADGAADVNGGGILIDANSTVTLDGVTVTDNETDGAAPGEGGGGIFNAGNLTITNSTIEDNDVNGAAGNGGGILNSNGASLAMEDSTVDFNSAARAGGGIENNGGTVTLTNVVVTDNSVGPMPGNGGGLHQGGAGSSVTVDGGRFDGNFAKSEGGGLWAASTSIIRNGTVFTDNLAAGLDSDQGGGALFNQAGNMTVTGVTITGNFAVSGDFNASDDFVESAGGASGGGILNNAPGTLTVADSTISNNIANRAGGGIEDNGGVVALTNLTMDGNKAGRGQILGADITAAPGNGGAVHSGGGGTVTVTSGDFTNNEAAREGGGIWTSGPATFTGITVTNNTGFGDASNQGGGGLFNSGGTMEVVDSTIDNNAATGTSGSGGGILNKNGNLTIRGGTVSNNSAPRAGGALEDLNGDTPNTVSISDVTMNGNSAGVDEITMNPGNGGAIHITGAGDMTISKSMFSNNVAFREGGALWNFGGGSKMTVLGSTIDGNMALGNENDRGGGGLFNNGGTLTVNSIEELTTVGADPIVTPMVISNNVASGTAGSGGGILNDGGTLVVSNTTMTSNSSVRAGGAIEDNARDNPTTTTLTNVTMDSNSTGPSPGNGGAFHVTGPGAITMDSSTASGNSAVNEGGGLWNHATSTMIIVNSTVSGNTAPKGGGVFSQPGSAATVSLTNSTIADNTGPGLEVGADAVVTVTNSIIADHSTDVIGSITASSSLIETQGSATIAGSNNVIGQDAQLAGLANNGGPTQTHLAASGPAIDGGKNTGCPSVDQRGEPRPADGDLDGNFDCDIGATEFGDNPVATTTPVETDDRDVADGDNNVPAAAFNFANGADEDVTVDSVSGVIQGGADLSKVRNITLLRNGVPVAGTFSLAQATGAFSVVPASGVLVGDGESATITVALSFGSTSAAWGLLAIPFLGMLIFRRNRMLMVLAAAGFFASACSDNDLTLAPGEDPGFYQVTVQSASTTGAETGSNGSVQGLPVTGAKLQAQ